MLSFKFYRWIRVMMGARSFYKDHHDGSRTHVLVSGNEDGIKRLSQMTFDMGYVEEWAPGNGHR